MHLDTTDKKGELNNAKFIRFLVLCQLTHENRPRRNDVKKKWLGASYHVLIACGKKKLRIRSSSGLEATILFVCSHDSCMSRRQMQ